MIAQNSLKDIRKGLVPEMFPKVECYLAHISGKNRNP